MKKPFVPWLFLAFALAMAGLACNSGAGGNRNSNRPDSAVNQNARGHNQVNHAGGMEHNAANTNSAASNQTPMNHSEMSHSEMKTAPDAKNAPFDLQFLDTMIAHHQGAVVMAKPALEKAQLGELKTLAQNIVAGQEKEIAQMREWREKWYPGKPPAMNMEMPGMADSMKGMDMKKLTTLAGKDFDMAFIDMMIPHHEGALAMSKAALEKAEHAEIKTLAQGIIMAQEAEIKTMQGWKAK